jgi:hypothetical protein
MQTMNMARLLAAAAMVATLLALPMAASAQTGRTLTLNLVAQGNSGVSGTATFTEMAGGRTQVVVRVSTGGNATMPAHVHDGRCPTPGAVVHPLNTVQNGTSASEINASIASLVAGTFAVNLHKSPQEASIYVACANVVATAGLPATGGAAGALPVVAASGLALAGAIALAARRRLR